MLLKLGLSKRNRSESVPPHPIESLSQLYIVRRKKCLKYKTLANSNVILSGKVTLFYFLRIHI